jgi:tripartite-type tricarboxylate transporter receptor subunit TctC
MARTRIALLLACIGSVMQLSATASAQSSAEFFQKTSLRLIVSTSAGGGYDAMGRLVARYMSKYLPGNPTIPVQNMPGAGGVLAVNYLANVATRDGSTFALLDRGVMTARILYGEDSKTQFEPRKLLWLGSVTKEAGVGLFSTRSGLRTLDDAKKREVVFGATGVETDPAMYGRLLNALFGTRFKMIPGYAGETGYDQAMMSGETDGMFASGWSGPNTIKELAAYRAGQVTYFIQMAKQRLAELPNVPTILDLLQTEVDRQIVDVVLSRLVLGTPFLAPPDVPADRLTLLRSAFRSAVSDEDFHKDVERQLNRVDPTYPQEAEKVIDAVFATPADVTQRLREIVKIAR